MKTATLCLLLLCVISCGSVSECEYVGVLKRSCLTRMNHNKDFVTLEFVDGRTLHLKVMDHSRISDLCNGKCYRVRWSSFGWITDIAGARNEGDDKS